MKPLEIGQTVKLVCEKTNPITGDGIFRYDGIVIITQNVKPMHAYNICIYKITKNCAFGDVV
jgi:predicted RNA-binding protein with TRAM domain